MQLDEKKKALLIGKICNEKQIEDAKTDLMKIFNPFEGAIIPREIR